MTTERDTEVSEPVAWMKWHKIYGAPDGNPPEWDVEFSTEEIAGGTPLYAAPLEGWLRAIDEELVMTHLGVANADDDYGTAKRKLNELICWHTSLTEGAAIPPEPTPTLTDEEIDELWVDYRGRKDKKQWRAFARAIEAKLKGSAS